MKGGKNAFALGFLLWLIMVTMTVVHSAEPSLDGFIYLKYGKKIKCDKAWIASEDIIRCKRGNDRILYLTDEVNIKKTFGITLEEWKSTHDKKMPTENLAHEEPKSLNTIHFKDDTIINCDKVWQGLEGNILCKKSNEVFAYNIGVVDLETTFGEAIGKEMGTEYKRRTAQVSIVKSLPDMAVESDEDKLDVKRQGGIDQRTIELETRRLEEKMQYYKRTCKANARRLTGDYVNRVIKGCKKNAKKIERELEELKNDPEFYFYKKNYSHKRRQKTIAMDVNTTERRKPQWLHDPFTGITMPRTGSGYTGPKNGNILS